jgi:hypothetical protein
MRNGDVLSVLTLCSEVADGMREGTFDGSTDSGMANQPEEGRESRSGYIVSGDSLLAMAGTGR